MERVDRSSRRSSSARSVEVGEDGALGVRQTVGVLVGSTLFGSTLVGSTLVGTLVGTLIGTLSPLYQLPFSSTGSGGLSLRV